ncbi:MAG: glycosyltransferase [Alphaproteobacteria bacterium]|nr:glycosyltransferase [Alphaproteobacteria bacterium]
MLVSIGLSIGGPCVALWLYLLFGRGRFWWGWTEPAAPVLASYPPVVAVIPARDEAPVIARAVLSLFRQAYPGLLRVVVVDDHSTDGTADAARRAAADADAADRLSVVSAPPLPAGWAGKVWAMESGYRHAQVHAADAPYLLFTDADIEHGPDSLKRLVSRADAGHLALVSLMVRLRTRSFAERALVPAFVFFFRMLYPFAWANDPASPAAAAAGGCMLLRRAVLDAIGGFSTLRSALIDDCALARAIKPQGPIRLDVADATASLRSYDTLADMWRLIARTAYDELRYSLVRLLAAVAGMALVFLAPPLLTVFGTGEAAWLGAGCWAAMAAAFVPCLRYYRASIAWAPALPLIALFYTAATVDSWRRHAVGRSGEWKGRVRGVAS